MDGNSTRMQVWHATGANSCNGDARASRVRNIVIVNGVTRYRVKPCPPFASPAVSCTLFSFLFLFPHRPGGLLSFLPRCISHAAPFVPPLPLPLSRRTLNGPGTRKGRGPVPAARIRGFSEGTGTDEFRVLRDHFRRFLRSFY